MKVIKNTPSLTPEDPYSIHGLLEAQNHILTELLNAIKKLEEQIGPVLTLAVPTVDPKQEADPDNSISVIASRVNENNGHIRKCLSDILSILPRIQI